MAATQGGRAGGVRLVRDGERYPGVGRRIAPQSLQLVDNLIEGLSLDELHGVEGGLAVLADLENRHDVRVMQLRRRLRLAAEALQGTSVAREPDRQQLEGDAASQRQLLRLVDDAHAATAQLADNPVTA